jgi:hypothetical protein
MTIAGKASCVRFADSRITRRVSGAIFHDRRSSTMGRYLLLWMLGIPLPILVLIYMFGGLH